MQTAPFFPQRDEAPVLRIEQRVAHQYPDLLSAVNKQVLDVAPFQAVSDLPRFVQQGIKRMLQESPFSELNAEYLLVILHPETVPVVGVKVRLPLVRSNAFLLF